MNVGLAITRESSARATREFESESPAREFESESPAREPYDGNTLVIEPIEPRVFLARYI